MKKSMVLVFSLWLIATAPAPQITAAADDADQSAAIVKAVQEAFGPAVEAMTALKPFHLTGDFNGDGIKDLFVVVNIKLKRSELKKDVLVLNPFYSDPAYPPGYPVDPAANPRRGFVIMHGAKTGWNHPLPRGKFLLAGDSPITVTMSSVTGPSEYGNVYFQLFKKGSKDYRNLSKRRAKGDLIDLPTNGAGSFLYWNGRTYRWEEYDAD